jgi:hypothetical protein
MKKATVVKSFLGVMLFTLGVVTGLVAQTLTDSPQRKEQKRSDLTGAPGMEVIESIVEYKTGETIDLHSHHGIEAVYVIQGTSIQPASQAPVTMPSGLTQMNLATNRSVERQQSHRLKVGKREIPRPAVQRYRALVRAALWQHI